MDTVGEGDSGMNGASGINTHTLVGERQIAGEKLPSSTGSPVWHSLMTRRDVVGGGEEASEERDICIVMVDLHCCMAETNTTW